MSKMNKIRITEGVYWVEVPEAQLFILCGCPEDSVKHLMKRGLIVSHEINGIHCETGPNAILLSDIALQNGHFSNLSEFPVMQMLYRQGMILPGHPNNVGTRPMLIGSESQVKSQMEYIYRGNYGLISEKEMTGAGVSSQTAKEMMRLKLRFAYGRIKATEELIDSRIIGNEPIELKNGVLVRRIKLNIFEFQYRGEYATVDLNLHSHKTYECPYPLGFHSIRREYFAVIHSGEGNGWDRNRPCMSSILMFQGMIYLIDAGPNILHTLNALGISVNEIEGIFHTHGHDDHFAGLTALMRSDHRIKYFATPLVRASVTRKMSALASIEEDSFSNYFEIHDLEPDTWNEIDGLEVKPTPSPHPVETTIFLFRTMCDEGYRSYAHLSDIITLDILKEFVTENDTEPGISQDSFERTKTMYITRTDLKKIDIGGGLIHGSAIDFQKDRSGKIILAHKSSELTNQEKEIGSGAPFGMVDILISTQQDYLWKYAFNYLRYYFPGASRHQINMVLNNPVVSFNPETILLKKEESIEDIYLILTGDVEMIRSDAGIHNVLSSGAFIGEICGLLGTKAKETYRASNFVKALQIPCRLYLEFVKRNGLYDEIVSLQEKQVFLQNTWLLGESISYPIQIELSKAIDPGRYKADEDISMESPNRISMVRQGRLEIYLNGDVVEILKMGDFFGEGGVLYGTTPPFKLRAKEPTEVYHIGGEYLLDIPIVYWKMFETYQKRMSKIMNPKLVSTPIFQWRMEYSTNVQEIDKDHEELFKNANRLYEAIRSGERRAFLGETLAFLIHYTQEHFRREERLMEEYDYPGKEKHMEKHRHLISEVIEMDRRYKAREIDMDNEFVNFLKDWVINHILTEDRKCGPFLNERGVF
jgi:hemerythrin